MTGQTPGGGAAHIQATAQLPARISKNQATNVDYRDDGVWKGKGLVKASSGFIPKGVEATRVFTHPTESPVRLEIVAQQAQTILGTSSAQASSLGGITLYDRNGAAYNAIGYVWNQEGQQEISIDRDAPITSARQLPLGKMNPNDTLYLYYTVPHGTVITRIKIGAGSQDASLTAP